MHIVGTFYVLSSSIKLTRVWLGNSKDKDLVELQMKLFYLSKIVLIKTLNFIQIEKIVMKLNHLPA